ncbi:hypothetical protein EC2021H102_23380 [Escherichia coli]
MSDVSLWGNEYGVLSLSTVIGEATKLPIVFIGYINNIPILQSHSIYKGNYARKLNLNIRQKYIELNVNI